MAGRQIHAESLEDASAQNRMVGKFLQEISASHRTDKDDCWIFGSVLLPGGRLAVADSKNWCVKLFDLKAGKLTGKLSFSLRPKDITAIGEDRLAVVFKDEGNWRWDEQQKRLVKQHLQHLQLLDVTPKLARTFTLPLPGRAYGGATCRGDKIYLTCRDPPSIQIFTLDGTLLSQINVIHNERDELFDIPRSIAVSPDGAHIYVRDAYKVLCSTTDGQKGQRYWPFHDDLLLRGMDVDTQGRLFVCSSDPPITILTSAGRRGTLELDKEVRDSETVAVGDGRMYLGGEYNVIYVFRLEAADSARQGEEVNGTFVRVEEGDEEGDEEEGETGEAVDNGRDDVYYDSEHGNHDNSDGEGDGESQSSDNTNTDKLMKWAILVVLMAITIMFLISVVSSYLWFD